MSTTRNQSHYRLKLSSRLALLEHTRQCRLFQNQSVPSACAAMRSPPESITVTQRLTAKRVMTAARSRKPNPGRFMPGFTMSGS
ncbi:TPA: hypothetical protein JDC63_004247 [Salmonella enterica subsp. arizonae]|nr:hypothetical protein [Salmonella enterica subsp. arizonae]ECS7301019.1 hypothetical protein [Salmonella enterica]ECE6855049.1 hypothetical protein [Salmonella enterica subsp. arizonae]ECI4778785.1 hypothetical protein [Salmonella enterica subsp. arizonae]ECI4826295.1 hypothetical protein [Salmonella enterica subsp. arizonae]